MASSMTGNRNQEELQTIQTQIHEKKTGILDSTRRMLGLISESEVIGTNTAAELVEQREKLENIEKRCDGIDANLISAQQNLNKLGSIFGGIKNYFQPPKSSFPKSISQPQMNNNAKNKTTAMTTSTARATNPKDDTDTYFGKPRSQMDDIERETDDGLHDIHQGVTRLKMLALHMNEELESQKPLTDRLDQKLKIINEDVVKKNKIMKKQLT